MYSRDGERLDRARLEFAGAVAIGDNAAIMKRVFVSLGVGVAIPALLILVMITSKILMGPGWVSIVLWACVWPLPVFVRLFPGMSQLSLALISFSVGAFLDVVIFSFLTYAALPLLKRKPRPTQLPPAPPSFDHENKPDYSATH